MHGSAISNRRFGAEYFSSRVFLQHCLARFRTLGYLLLASCGTLGRCLRNPWVPWIPDRKSPN